MPRLYRIRYCAWLGLLALLSLPLGTRAADVETLVMPGPLIQGHAKYETQCSRCHAKFSKKRQSTLCLACHKKVAGDIRGGKGYHGRIENIRTTECKSCHTDHKGRNADIVQLDRETFDHRKTDFMLKGAHRGVACTSCHKSDKPFRDAPSRCVSCHRKDDRHKGRLGDDCGSCHDARAWNRPHFDHSKTDYPLVGRHKKVACNGCHINQRYKKTPTTCYSCHAVQDVHAGRYGRKCDSCHSPSGWKKSKFNHDKDTDFPLHGAHKDVPCSQCHAKDPFKHKIASTCYSCHRYDDRHNGRYGKKCETCHEDTGWSRVSFNHDKDTDFPLRGAHRKADCDACHQGPLSRSLSVKCVACHRADDVHRGQQGTDCAQCHNESSWNGRVLFDHGLTRFPLVGQHAVVPCEECHANATYKNTPTDCASCHAGKDAHHKRLGSNCEQCHNPSGWNLWHFDHDTQTDYPLKGSHRGLQCEACHTRPAGGQKPVHLSDSCYACHQADDTHRGGFGTNCGRCHETSSFSDVHMP
ncbi:MAG: cytochrome C [Gammaproteobacteria bacterium]